MSVAQKLLVALTCVFSCFLWAGSSSDELSAFRTTPFYKHSPGSAFHQCVRSLRRAGLRVRTVALEELPEEQGCWIESFSTYSKRNPETGERLVCQLKGWGTLNPDAEGVERFSMHNGELVNFGLVPDRFDFKNSLSTWIEWRGENGREWKGHVTASIQPLRAALRNLGVRAKVETSEDFTGRPALLIRFDTDLAEGGDLRPVFENFRGIRVNFGLFDFAAEAEERAARKRPPSRFMQGLLSGIESARRFPQRRVPMLQIGSPTPVRISYSAEAHPTTEETNLSKLGPDLKREVLSLLEGRTNRWSAHYAVRVRVEDETAAQNLGLTRLLFTKTYSANWSLEQIARATGQEGLISVFSDRAANRQE